jgi:predicted metal-binding membrane protein
MNKGYAGKQERPEPSLASTWWGRRENRLGSMYLVPRKGVFVCFNICWSYSMDHSAPGER